MQLHLITDERVKIMKKYMKRKRNNIISTNCNHNYMKDWPGHVPTYRTCINMFTLIISLHL